MELASQQEERKNNSILSNSEDVEISDTLIMALVEALSSQNIDTKSIGLDTMRRFLRARNLNVEKASRMLIENIAWRKNFVPKGSIDESEIVQELAARKGFLQVMSGRTPLLIAVYKNHFAKQRDLEEFKRFSIFCIDKIIDCLPPGVEKFSAILDVKDAGISNFDSVAMIEGFGILQNHYPERLGRVYMIHVPYLFWGIWKIVEPFIDKNTRKKIYLVEDTNLNQTLLKEFPAEMLPAQYGGTASLVPVEKAEIPNHSPAS